MDNTLLDAISKSVLRVGFPVIMCLLLWHQMLKSDESHKEEVNGLKDVIADVKIAITELKDAIQKGSK